MSVTPDGRPYAVYPRVQDAPIDQRSYNEGRLTLEQINFLARRAAELGGFNTVESRPALESDGSPIMEYYDEDGAYQEHVWSTPLILNEQGRFVSGGDVIREWITPKGEIIASLPKGLQQREKIIEGGQVPFDDWRAAKIEFEELHDFDGGVWTKATGKKSKKTEAVSN